MQISITCALFVIPVALKLLESIPRPSTSFRNQGKVQLSFLGYGSDKGAASSSHNIHNAITITIDHDHPSSYSM